MISTLNNPKRDSYFVSLVKCFVSAVQQVDLGVIQIGVFNINLAVLIA